MLIVLVFADKIDLHHRNWSSFVLWRVDRISSINVHPSLDTSLGMLDTFDSIHPAESALLPHRMSTVAKRAIGKRFAVTNSRDHSWSLLCWFVMFGLEGNSTHRDCCWRLLHAYWFDLNRRRHSPVRLDHRLVAVDFPRINSSLELD